MLCGTQAAAEVEAQVRERGFTRGKHLHEAGREASPMAQLTAVRLADSSAGQHALGALAAAAERTDGPTLSSYAACTAARRARASRRGRRLFFASAKGHLKSLVEQKGALSTLERWSLRTGASHNAFAHCLRLPRARQGPLPSAPTVPPPLPTFAFFLRRHHCDLRPSNSAIECRLYDRCCLRARRLLRRPPAAIAAHATAATRRRCRRRRLRHCRHHPPPPVGLCWRRRPDHALLSPRGERWARRAPQR